MYLDIFFYVREGVSQTRMDSKTLNNRGNKFLYRIERLLTKEYNCIPI